MNLAFFVVAFLLLHSGTCADSLEDVTVTAADCREGTHLGTFRSDVLLPESTITEAGQMDGHFFILAKGEKSVAKVTRIDLKVEYMLTQCGGAHHTVLALPPMKKDLILDKHQFDEVRRTKRLTIDLTEYLPGYHFDRVTFRDIGDVVNDHRYLTTRGSGIHLDKTFPTDAEVNQIVCTGRTMYYRNNHLPYMVCLIVPVEKLLFFHISLFPTFFNLLQIGWASVTLDVLEMDGTITPDGDVALRLGIVLGGECRMASTDWGGCFVPTFGNFMVSVAHLPRFW